MSAIAPPAMPNRTPGRLRTAIMSIVGSLGSAAICVAITVALLATLPATNQETERPYSYGEKVHLVLKTTYDRVIRPRSPAARAGYRNWILTLQSATPILLTGLAVAAAFRANVLNIGTQGQYVLGAIAAAAIGIYIPAARWLLIPLLLAGAMAAGALFAGIAATLERWRNVPVVLSTLLLNFVALEFLRYMLQGPMRAVGEDGRPLDPQSTELAEFARLPQFFSDVPRQGLHLGFVIAVAAALVLWFILRKTTFGFRLRVVGQNPVAARFAGMNAARVSFATLALSGALAGLAGGVQIAGTTYVLYPDVGTDGLGFTGIAVALLARLSPIGVIFSAIFFGLLKTAFVALQESPLEIHSNAAQAVQGLLVIAVLIVSSPQWRRLVGHVMRRDRAAAA
ncbi:MAG: inner-rane translocator [Phycisphaerales bacterium]|nr:inner-rane translocator [Phycisphaerales bacterium]